MKTSMGASRSDELDIKKQHPRLYDSLIPLLRSESNALEAYLEKVACEIPISATQAKAHCYLISLDGNKRPRVNDFAKFIGNKIVDFAIPRNQVIRALRDAVRIGSTAPIIDLNKKAQKLFSKLPKSGEGGEVLLSVLAETFLRIPQIFTKMALKTNSEMHVHGSDGIHLGVNESNGNLAIYWGESKLYKNVSSAVRECFNSLSPFLLEAGGSGATQERDLQLIRDGLTLEDANLENAIKRYLDPDDPLFRRMEFRGVCLLGFDSSSYPTAPNSKEMKEIRQEMEKAFESCKKLISSHVIQKKIHSYTIEVFCLPFPSVEDYRSAFRKELNLS